MIAAMKRMKRTLLSIGIAIGLTACGGEENSDLHTYIKEVKARKPGKIEPIPKPQQTPPYIYLEAELRDPYTPIIRIVARPDKPVQTPPPVPKHDRFPLEDYPLNSLKMVGSVEKNGIRWALIQTQDGTLVRTKKNEYMGQDNGKIVRITEAEVELQEIVDDGLGGWVKRQAIISVAE